MQPPDTGRLRSVHPFNVCRPSAVSTPPAPLSSPQSAPSASPRIPRAYAHTHSARAFCRQSSRRVFYNVTDLNWQALEWCHAQNNIYPRVVDGMPQQLHDAACSILAQTEQYARMYDINQSAEERCVRIGPSCFEAASRSLQSVAHDEICNFDILRWTRSGSRVLIPAACQQQTARRLRRCEQREDSLRRQSSHPRSAGRSPPTPFLFRQDRQGCLPCAPACGRQQSPLDLQWHNRDRCGI